VVFSVFEMANMSRAISLGLAAMIAFILNAPPYALGLVWKKKNEEINIDEMKQRYPNAKPSKESKRKRSQFWIAMTMLFLVNIITLSGYLFLRILSFLGGGDFASAFQVFMSGELDFSQFVVSGADLMTIASPLVTSAVSFTVATIVFVSKVDYMKDVIVYCTQSIEERITGCDDIMQDTMAKIASCDEAIETLKCDIWSLYYPDSIEIEENGVRFKLLVSKAYRALNISSYSNTYATASRKLLNAAHGILGDINAKIAAYLEKEIETIERGIDSAEQRQLESLWFENDTANDDIFAHQTLKTKEDMRLIEEKIIEVSAKYE
jgi:hypothetical protein